MNITVLDATSANVLFTPPEDATNITNYDAVILDGASGRCSVIAGGVPLACNLSSLEAGKSYTIGAFSCSIVSSDCSAPRTATFKMVPPCEFSHFIYISLTILLN